MSTKVTNNFSKTLKRLQKGCNKTVMVGVFADSQRDSGKVTNGELALIHEYGTETIPPRPFIGPVVNSNQQEYAKALAKLVRANIETTEHPDKAYELIGQKAVGDIRGFVMGWNMLQPLAPATIAAKGSSKPLIDSSQMIRSISYKVVDKGSK